MIRINLTPLDELENPYWWVFDAVALILVLAVGYWAVDLYLNEIRNEIASINANRGQLDAEIEQLSSDAAKFNELDARLTNLNETVKSIRGIAISRVTRYRPVIVLEHLQTLKPQGIWFYDLSICNRPDEFEPPKVAKPGAPPPPLDASGQPVKPLNSCGSPDHAVVLKGRSFDNLIIAEFLSSIIATNTQEIDDTDLRTQVAFSNVILKVSSLQQQYDRISIFEFELTATLIEKEAGSERKNVAWLNSKNAIVNNWAMFMGHSLERFKWKSL